ncbi:EAL domain-containing response regulator [Viridibacterium curvum]|uniref:EAL domain-containing response regulator n=1 Tax=Viridibacterium curvum TaxID=1101404 RepID=A0ABP9QXP4_9RHOO
MYVLPASLAERGVMVVEDSVVQRAFTVAQLRELGVTQVSEAQDGADALRKLGELSPQPAVLIIDLEMPIMDGAELIHRLAGMEGCPALIVASSRERRLVESVVAMVNELNMPLLGIIQKPVDGAQLGHLLTGLDSIKPTTKAVKPSNDQCLTRDELSKAIATQQIVPYFQPKISLRSGAMTGVEALARWVTPDGSIITPNRFIPLAEKSGLMNEMTLCILEQSLIAMQDWETGGLMPSVAINLSASSLGDMVMGNAILERIEKAGEPYERIVLEITESVLVDSHEAVRDLIRLRLRGCCLAIDDYGTGFSSMAQLTRIPFSELKLDRSFVNGAAENPSLRAMLESSIALARQLGLETVAEGVECATDLALLRRLGCDVAQGFFLSRPLPASRIPEFAASLAVTS